MSLFLFRRIAVGLFLFLMTKTAALAQQIVNFETELNRLYTIGLLPDYMEGTVVKQISSYDRTGGNDDGFGGTYSFLREESDGGLVIFDEKGQGVIERIWTPTPTDDTVDFYLDGSAEPSISIRHQIQFRNYNEKYPVGSYDPSSLGQYRALLDKIVGLWSKKSISVDDFTKSGTVKVEKSLTLNPNSSEMIFELNQGGRLVGIELEPPDAFFGIYKQIDLKISWNDEERPAVYVPAADFFGFAFGPPSMESLLIGVKDNKAYSYIPMPFDRKAKVELVYRGGNEVRAVSLRANVYYEKRKQDSEYEGRFYAYWKNEKPALGVPYVFLEGQGKRALR